MLKIVSKGYKVVDSEIPTKKSVTQLIRDIESDKASISDLKRYIAHPTGHSQFDRRIKIYYLGHTEANSSAMRELGLFYEKGHLVKKNKQLAHQYIYKAAEASDPKAMRTLGRYFEKGIGCKQSMSKAERWYKKAADAGNKQAKKDWQWCRELNNPTGRNIRYLAARTVRIK